MFNAFNSSKLEYVLACNYNYERIASLCISAVVVIIVSLSI